MKYLRDTKTKLEAVQARILAGMVRDFGTHAVRYDSIIRHQSQYEYALEIDETDARNPIQYLTDAERAKLLDALPDGWFPPPPEMPI